MSSHPVRLLHIAIFCSLLASSLRPVYGLADTIAHNPSSVEGKVGTLSSSIFGEDYLREVESLLRDTYGEREVEFFRRMISDFDRRHVDDEALFLDDAALESHVSGDIGEHFPHEYAENDSSATDYDRRKARALVVLIKEQFRALDEVHSTYVKPHLTRFSQIRELSKQESIYTDTPCSTQAGCDRLEMLVNLCSAIRGGSHLAYEIFVIMVHVLATMMAVLCGCLFTGPVRICFLQNFPYTCRIPYPVFSGLFQATTSVWQVVKVVTNICRIYGDPGFGSIFA
ncbi:membrane protein, putative [Babesia bigemina]|uniref:Membrane protein, putative n=1 Tax=Babesia bigemina TaxID=5866 RepID=A0A061D553_BABBI|nr:membrane protein, putative [Babesia bigemina]CDR95698.1 membrane protein, putative [Babesia bigemina]|eukprot:XP_012767884.1 membrane protein, putative [Babesia bigemina]